MARFLLVKAEALPGLPKAFQDFVGDHFAKKVVGEMEYFYAFCWVGQPGKTTKGNAPGHSVDTGHYRGGLKDGQSLSKWLDEYLNDPTHEDILSFYGTEYRLPGHNHDD